MKLIAELEVVQSGDNYQITFPDNQVVVLDSETFHKAFVHYPVGQPYVQISRPGAPVSGQVQQPSVVISTPNRGTS